MNQQVQEVRLAIKTGGAHVTSHSGEVKKGDVFVALPAPLPRGSKKELPGGEVHAEEAAAAGAAFIVCDEHVAAGVRAAVAAYPACAVVPVANARITLGELAKLAFPRHHGGPKVIGLTGTNGKTTTSYLLEHILTHAGKRVGVIGTVAYRWPGFYEDAPLTTPNCVTLHSLLSRMAEEHVDYAVMEVSSHALDQDRVAGIDFCAGLLTNMTQDHLDYHPDMEHYFQAKSRLFLSSAKGGVPSDDKVCVCNADDPFSLRLLREDSSRIGFGLRESRLPGNRYLYGRIVSHSPSGLHLAMQYEGMTWELHVPLVGVFNAQNILGAQAVALGLGFSPDHMLSLERFSGVPGRLQQVPNSRGISVFVDYAHTPDALVNVLGTLREAGFGRVIAVFGCGGNRDAGKRPLMGEAVARLSDVAIVTSDNPRDEDPEQILADIRPGLARCKVVFEEVDRRQALKLALEQARPGDALLVAGKGHETYQIIKGVKYDFDDVAILREMLA